MAGALSCDLHLRVGLFKISPNFHLRIVAVERLQTGGTFLCLFSLKPLSYPSSQSASICSQAYKALSYPPLNKEQTLYVLTSVSPVFNFVSGQCAIAADILGKCMLHTCCVRVALPSLRQFSKFCLKEQEFFVVFCTRHTTGISQLTLSCVRFFAITVV